MLKTQNYNLNQWESTDPIRREDFNADNAAIDAALGVLNTAVSNAGNCKIMTGSWTGDGTAPRTVQLSVIPELLFIFFEHYNGTSMVPALIVAMDGRTRYFRGTNTSAYCGDPKVVALSGNTVIITDVNWCNLNGQTINYVAFY